uniref:Uncharacterized protein n=1 Tax=Opuntia streptacantha TaxID=393608 RepID=A0A7C8YBZ6_OPUST
MACSIRSDGRSFNKGIPLHCFWRASICQVLPPCDTRDRIWAPEHWKSSSKEKTKWGNRITPCNPLDLLMDTDEVPSHCVAGLWCSIKVCCWKRCKHSGNA